MKSLHVKLLHYMEGHGESKQKRVLRNRSVRSALPPKRRPFLSRSRRRPTEPAIPSRATEHSTPALLPILAELLPRGDGTYLLKPRPVDADMDSWVSSARASEMIGLNVRSIYRLVDPNRPYLVHKRPLKKLVLISVKSIYAYIRATSDPDFWSDRVQQKALEESVRKQMKALCLDY